MLFAAGCAAILNWRQQARQPRFSVGPGNRGDGFEQGLLLVPPRGADETPDFALAQNENPCGSPARHPGRMALAHRR
jgi:hypothetical protein